MGRKLGESSDGNGLHREGREGAEDGRKGEGGSKKGRDRRIWRKGRTGDTEPPRLRLFKNWIKGGKVGDLVSLWLAIH